MNTDAHASEEWGPHQSREASQPEALRGSAFPFWQVVGGIALTLVCVVSIYVALEQSADSDVWRALVFTMALTGAPVVFLGVRLVMLLTAHRQGTPIRFWPQDRSAVVNWGLTLLWLNLGLAGVFAFVSLDYLLFDGQILDWLSYFQT